jgi:hypothetical protein
MLWAVQLLHRNIPLFRCTEQTALPFGLAFEPKAVMSKKVFWIILIPALLLIGGYIVLQIYLRTSATQNGEKGREQLTNVQNTAANGKAAGSQSNDKTRSDSKPDDKVMAADAVTASAREAEDSSKKSSPLDLRPLLIKKMQQLVKKSSNGLYDLIVSDLTLDVLASTVALHGVRLRPDAAVLQDLKSKGLLPQQVLSLSFDDLVIDGINIDDAITSKSMDYKLVKLVNPVIEIDRYKANKKSSSDGDFSQRFLQQMEKLAVEKLQVQGGSITVHDKVKGGTQKLQKVAVLMKDILLNDASRNDKNRFLFAKEAQLEFHDFSMQSKDKLYTMKIGDAFINATGRKVELKNVSYGSPLSKQEFVARQKVAKEKYDLRFPTVTISGIDWWEAMNGDEISAGQVSTAGGKLAVFFDRRLPPTNKMGSFPNQLLAKLPKKLDIDKINLRNLSFSYEEFNPKTGQSGTVVLDKVAMAITNVTNKRSNQKPVEVDGTALLMGEVPVTTKFTFDMKKPEAGNFTATLQLDSFQAPIMNSVTEPLGLLKVDRGDIHSVFITMKGNEKEAAGEALVRYDKLKSFDAEEKGERTGTERKKAVFAAGQFAGGEE